MFSLNSRAPLAGVAAVFVTASITHAGFPDCNVNGIDDADDILSGTSTDDNFNTIPDECEATILYVDAAATGPIFNGISWDNAYTDLQDALAVAGNAGNAAEQIWVAGETYTPDGGSGDRTLSYALIDGVALYGGFAGDEVALGDRDPDANPTILSGDIGVVSDASDNSFHVVRGTGNDASAVIDGFTITGGNADGGGDDASGGGFRLDDALPSIRDCDVTGNTAAENGGGIYCAGLTARVEGLTLIDCLVDGNFAGTDGGGLFGLAITIAVADSTFSNNTANGVIGSGGAMWLETCLAFVSDSSFESNTAAFGGGAIVAGAGTKLLGDTVSLTDNTALAGGALWAFGDSTTNVTGWSFTTNVATNRGGACNINDTRSTFTDCVWVGNGAGDAGGAISGTNGARLTLFTSLFNANTAGAGGGAIGSFAGASIFGADSTFDGNVAASDGGAIATSAGACGVANCQFVANTAGGSGGAVQDNGSAATYSNCLFAGNSATGGSGGAVNISGSAATGRTIGNCTVTANTAAADAGGVLVSAFAVATVSNTILWENTDGGDPDESAQITDLSGTADVNYCDIQALSGALGGVGNIDADPMFVDPLGLDATPGTGDEDYRLSSGSPCIDAADNVLIPPDFMDLDQNGDFSEPTPIDLDGNPRRVDDPGTPDTGPPPAPVVDMGVLEFVSTCPEDLDGDGLVGFADLTMLLAMWGPCPGCPADFDGDGDVGFADLTQLLGAWGPC